MGQGGSPDHTWPLVLPLITPWGDDELPGGRTRAHCLFLEWVVLTYQGLAKIHWSLFRILFSLAKCAAFQTATSSQVGSSEVQPGYGESTSPRGLSLKSAPVIKVTIRPHLPHAFVLSQKQKEEEILILPPQNPS